MARPSDIIKQLQSVLPKYTSDFYDTKDIINASITGKEITLTYNGIITVDTLANIKGVYCKIAVTDIVAGDEDNQWILTTEIDHDQTYSDIEKELGIEKTVLFSGDFSGSKVLVDVPANDKIIIESTEEPEGDFFLLENRGYSDRKTVVIDNTAHTLKYDVDYEIDPIVVSGEIINNIRISTVASEDNIIDLLENKTIALTKNTIFLLMGETLASSDRKVYSDAKNRKASGEDLTTEYYQTFTVFIVIPTQGNTTPYEAIESIHTLRPYMIKCLHGAAFESGFSNRPYLCTYTGDAGADYNKAYYVHRFDFENGYLINGDDSISNDDSRAFRNFEIGIKLEYDDYKEAKKIIEATIE